MKFTSFTKWLADINNFLTSLCSFVIFAASHCFEESPLPSSWSDADQGEEYFKILSPMSSQNLKWASLWLLDIKEY